MAGLLRGLSVFALRPPEEEVELVIKKEKEQAINSPQKVKEETLEEKISKYQKLKKQLLDMNKVPYS